MAIPYEALLPEILPLVNGCPDQLIQNTVRSAVIELCEKSEAYQLQLDPLTTVSNIYEYDLESPSGTSVHKILWMTHSGKDLEPITSTLLEQRLPKWRTESGVPVYFIQQGSGLVHLAPVPTDTVVGSTNVE